MRVTDATIVRTERLPNGNLLVTYDDATQAVASADGTLLYGGRKAVTLRTEE